MAEINMNDYDTFDENIGALKSNLSSKEKLDYYLSRLNERINGEASVSKIRDEVYNFIYVNTLMNADIKKHLIELVDGNYTDGNKLSSDILFYLKNAYEDAEYVFEENNEKIEEVKDDFVDRIENNLNDSNVDLTGDTTTLKEELDSKEKLDKLNTEVDSVRDMLPENEDKLGLTTNDLIEAVNSPKDDVLVDKIEEQLSDKNNFEVTEEGTIEINGSLLNNNDQNYVTMMVAGLVASSENLDMYLSKDKKNNNDYKVTFGNLPVRNHPENRISPEIISKVNEISNNYNSTINYQEALYNMDANLGTLNEIVFSEMNSDGTMKVGINNHNGNYNIGINMSSEYQNLADALNANGASVSMDNNENSIVRLDGDKLDQYSVLSNTKSTLEKEEEKELNNNYQYVKKMELPDNEAAKVSPYFLIVVAITELLLVGFYFIFLFK